MSKILVIEDEKNVRSNILELLRAEGFEPIEAEGGTVGLDLARQEKPDLILCDVMMTDLDGFEVLARLRQSPDTATIPFIFVTAKTTRSDQRQGMKLGADDYLTKPFTGKELLEAIEGRMNRQQAVSQLHNQIEELQELNLLKDDLISSLSHDLRTPLLNMKMAIEMLRVAPDSPQRNHYLEILRQECIRETNLVNNLLELQRLEATINQLTPEPINLGNWLSQLTNRFTARLQDADQTLILLNSEAMPLLLSDRTSLDRVMDELLSNACKYTSTSGKIEVQAFLVGEGDRVCIQVRNSTAVPSESLARLFEKFYRLPGSDLRKQGGSGLGLAVVQKVVQKLQGTIEVSSSNGWITFAIILPRILQLD